MGAPDERETEPAPIGGDEPWDQRQGAGSVAAMPIPWKMRAAMNGADGPPGSTPGRRRMRAADQVGHAAGGERAQATDTVDDDAGDERGRDLDQRRGPDDQPDLGIGDAGSRQGDGQRCRERMEPGLHGEEGDGKPEHRPIIGHVAGSGLAAGPGGPGPRRVGGSAGPAEPGGLAGTTHASRRRSPATYPTMHPRLSGPKAPPISWPRSRACRGEVRRPCVSRSREGRCDRDRPARGLLRPSSSRSLRRRACGAHAG